MKKQEISNGLTIEQLEERMEFTAMAVDASSLSADQIAAARAAGYTEADAPLLCSGDGGGNTFTSGICGQEVYRCEF